MKFLVILSIALLGFIHADDSKVHIPEKCSDVLAVKVCDRLQNTATKLKLKSEEVKNAVIDAYKQGKTKSDEIYKSADNFLKQKILTKKCEDFTTLENCQRLRKLAVQSKIQADKVNEFVMKQIAELKTKECEDFLNAKQCAQLKELTDRLKIKSQKLEEIMMDAYLDAKSKGTEMITEAYDKVKTYVMTTRCEDVFNPQVCVSFRNYAAKTKVALPVIMATAFDLAQKGVAISTGFVKKVYDLVDYMYDCTDIFDQSSCDRLKRWASVLNVQADKFEILFKKYVRIAVEKGTSVYKTVKDQFFCRIMGKCNQQADISEDENLEDDVSYGLLEDWKQQLLDFLHTRFPNIESNMRVSMEKLITKAKSKVEFVKNLVTEMRSAISYKWANFLLKFMKAKDF